MIHLKSIGVGLLTAAFAAIASVVLQILWALMVVALQTRQADTGSGGIGAVSTGFDWMMPAAITGFLFGCWWQFRKRRA